MSVCFTCFFFYVCILILSNYLKTAINKQIARHLVLPNKRIISLMPNVDTNALRINKPIGLIKVEVIGAKNVKSVFSDFFSKLILIVILVFLNILHFRTKRQSLRSSCHWQ